MTVVGTVAALLVSDRYGTADELTKGGRWFLVRVAIAALAFWLLTSAPVRASLPTVSFERTPTGGRFNLHRPERWGKRKLRTATAELARDVRAYLKTTPDTSVETLKDQHATMQAIRQGATETEQNELFNQQTLRSVERWQQERDDLGARFGGRLRHIAGEYQRRGLLTESQVAKLEWQASSSHWMREAVMTLEALALKL